MQTQLNKKETELNQKETQLSEMQMETQTNYTSAQELLDDQRQRLNQMEQKLNRCKKEKEDEANEYTMHICLQKEEMERMSVMMHDLQRKHDRKYNKAIQDRDKFQKLTIKQYHEIRNMKIELYDKQKMVIELRKDIENLRKRNSELELIMFEDIP